MYNSGGSPYKKHIENHTDFCLESYKTENGEFSSVVLGKKNIVFDERLEEEVTGSVAKSLIAILRKNKIKKQGLVLVVGLGNDEMTVDALGVKTLGNLEITEHLFQAGKQHRQTGRLAAIKGSVSGITGIQSFDIIKAVVERIKPAAVIAVDTLSCKHVSRLGRVIQITDMGIAPGSGVGDEKTALTAESLGVPVISIGVPLVIYAENIISGYVGEGTLSASASGIRKISSELADLYVTAKDIDIIVQVFAHIIGNGINQAIHR